MAEHQRAVDAAPAGRRPRRLLRGPTLWLAGAGALTIAATAAAAGPLGASRLVASPAGSPALVTVASPLDGTTTPDAGRGRRHPGAARTPVAKVTLTEADAGKTITVKPGTEIDVALKPDSGSRWSPPRSSNPQSVSRGGRMGGWRWGGGQGRRQGTPDFGPGGGRRGMRDGSTHAVFFAHRDGDANLTSAERKGGFFLPGRQSTPSKSWSVKVTVSGPAPAAPRPNPKPVAPAPALPAAPGTPSSGSPADVHRLVTPVTSTVQRLGVTLPRL